MDKIDLVAKDKPKVTYKEVKRKMKKLTLTQKNRIKEDKKEQRTKEKAEKQRISQRVKININIPTSKAQSNPIINPLNQSSREQISLLNSINEQLKNKNKPTSINDMFKIPPKRTIETQTESPVNRVIETQKEDNFNEGMEYINNELRARLSNINTELPEQFSPKVETPIPIIKEPYIPIISKPKEKSNESLIEQASPISFIEELREKQKIIKPKSEEETIQMETELKKGRPKSDMNEGRVLTDEEVLQNRIVREVEQEERRKANEEDNRQAEKQKEKEQINKVEAEYKRKQKENNAKKGVDYAFNVLTQYVEDPQELDKLREAYTKGFLKAADIRKKLMDLRTDDAKPKKVYTKQQVDEFFNRYK
jgi:hypothetical protein